MYVYWLDIQYGLDTCKKKSHLKTYFETDEVIALYHRLLDSLVLECWLRVRAVPGSIPYQGLRHTKDVIKMVPVVPLFSTQH